jgi:hypothetical protein
MEERIGGEEEREKARVGASWDSAFNEEAKCTCKEQMAEMEENNRSLLHMLDNLKTKLGRLEYEKMDLLTSHQKDQDSIKRLQFDIQKTTEALLVSKHELSSILNAVMESKYKDLIQQIESTLNRKALLNY